MFWIPKGFPLQSPPINFTLQSCATVINATISGSCWATGNLIIKSLNGNAGRNLRRELFSLPPLDGVKHWNISAGFCLLKIVWDCSCNLVIISSPLVYLLGSKWPVCVCVRALSKWYASSINCMQVATVNNTALECESLEDRARPTCNSWRCCCFP